MIFNVLPEEMRGWLSTKSCILRLPNHNTFKKFFAVFQSVFYILKAFVTKKTSLTLESQVSL